MNSKKIFPMAIATCLFFSFHAMAAYVAPSTLITQFESLFGPNKWAKLVWQTNAFSWGNENNKLLKMDTKTGVVDTLVSTGSNGYKSDPTFTWDGARIIYQAKKAVEIRVVNWDGTNDRVVLKNYNGAGHCWRSNGKDYVLATDIKGLADIDPNGSKGRHLYKVNINDTTDKILVLTTTWAASIAEVDNQGTRWASINEEGTMIAGGFPDFGSVGSFTVGSSGPVIFSDNGCWPTVARDNTGDVFMTIGDHTQFRLAKKSGAAIQTWDVPLSIRQDNAGIYETLRWTADRNFATCLVCTESTPKTYKNPFVVRLDNLQSVYLNAAAPAPEGNMDLFFYTSTDIKKISGNTLAKISPLKNTKSTMFDLTGKNFSNQKNSPSRVLISMDPAGAVTARAKINK